MSRLSRVDIEIRYRNTLSYESTRGLAGKPRTHDHQIIINIVSSSPATASMFVSSGKILNLNLLR